MFHHFNVRVKHDNGIVTIRTAAQSEEAARQIVISAERCPEGSILSVKMAKPANRYPTKAELTARLAPNAVECFFVSRDDAQRARYEARRSKTDCLTPNAGWYFWTCLPGCLPDSDPFGPYKSPLAVLRAAYDQDFLGE